MLTRLLRSAPVRKGRAFAQKPLRYARRLTSGAAAYAANPPVVVNSLPKSGTHLLMQIAEALPGTRNWGTFIAQTPSRATRPRPQAVLDSLIGRLVPGEVVGAHLHRSPGTEAALRRQNALHLFIHRDPRDVLISEAHYLAHMNPWHALHKPFRAAKDDAARIDMAIEGLGTAHYPDIATRIAPYLAWIGAPGTVALTYEEMTGPGRAAALAKILAAWRAQGGTGAVREEDLARAIAPERSHTFHKGGSRWQSQLSAAQKARLRGLLPDLDWPA